MYRLYVRWSGTTEYVFNFDGDDLDDLIWSLGGGIYALGYIDAGYITDKDGTVVYEDGR